MLTEARRPPTQETRNIWPWVAVAAGAVSAIVMFLNLETGGLNGDEGFTAQMVKLPLEAMLADLRTIDYNMSLHYVFLKGWSSIFGFSESALRLPSVLAVLASLPILYRLVATLADRRLAALAVAFFALNPFVLMVGLTARTYGLLLLWSVFATWRLHVAIERDTSSSWLWYGGVAAVGLHLHLLAAMVIAAHGVFTLVRQRKLRSANLSAAAVIVIFGLVPTAIFLAPASTLSWIGPFSPTRALSSGLALAGGGVFAVLVIGLVLIGMLRPSRAERRLSHLAAVWLVTPVVLCLALAPIQSLFVDIYFTIVAVPTAILAAIGLARLLDKRKAWLVPAGLALAVLGLALGLTQGRVVDTQGWRELSQLMAGKVAAGDFIAFPNSYYRIVTEYYAADPDDGPFPPGAPTLPPAEWGTARPLQLDRLKRTGGQSDHDEFEIQIVGFSRVWLVGINDEFNRTVIADLEEHGYRLHETVEFDGARALLYVRG